MIPKKLHIVWVGDESKRPDNCISTWVRKNPDWVIRVWGNDDLFGRSWINANHMMDFAERELCGVADMMRYEILYQEGGLALDADSVCRRPLEDWLLEAEAFTCWENEIARPGLLANGVLAALPENPLIGQIIQSIKDDEPEQRMAWQFSGPVRLTSTWIEYAYTGLTVYPSHYFLPRHFSGTEHTGRGIVFADQHWGSTKRIYDKLHEEAVAERE